MVQVALTLLYLVNLNGLLLALELHFKSESKIKLIQLPLLLAENFRQIAVQVASSERL